MIELIGSLAMQLDTKPELSVIIPITKIAGNVLNLEKSLKGCFGLNIEVILVHDIQDAESAGAIQEVLCDLQVSAFPLIILTEGEFGNPGAARNHGLSQAHSEWVTFWDADDVAIPSAYLELRSLVEQKGCSIGIGQFVRIESRTGKRELSKLTEKATSLEIALDPGFWRIVYKSSIAKRTFFPKLRIGEDLVYLIQNKALEESRVISDTVIYEYHLGVANQLTSSPSSFNDSYFAVEKASVWILGKVEISKEDIYLFGRLAYSLFWRTSGPDRRRIFINVARFFNNLKSKQKVIFIHFIAILIRFSIMKQLSID
jgi:glycosyltransferase involved in cell wall biosynthesis